MSKTIKLENGKYAIQMSDSNGVVTAFRFDEYWRDLTGDKLYLALFNKIEEVQAEAASNLKHNRYLLDCWEAGETEGLMDLLNKALESENHDTSRLADIIKRRMVYGVETVRKELLKDQET